MNFVPRPLIRKRPGLGGVVGFCFGSPPGGGVRLIVGLVLSPVTWLLFASLDE